MNIVNKADVLICGAGIVGLAIARELIKSGRDNIVIIEKEAEPGQHASGRNSGVLHSGVYYAPDTFKAQFCLRGLLLMKEYCKEKNLPVLECGKVIVTREERGEQDLAVLKELEIRAVQNGAKVRMVDEKELSEIEPNAKTYKQALYSEYTAVVDPKNILSGLADDLVSSGKVKIIYSSSFIGTRNNNTVITSKGDISFNLFINAAGTYSDQVAHPFGVGLEFKLIPFKGIYRRLVKSKAHMVKGNIYPVPNIKNPFLGVHFTRNIYGDVYIGPTAIPAFGRENYGIISGIDIEALEIIYREALLFFNNSKFRQVALTEPKKYIFKNFFNDAKGLVKEIDPKDIERCSKVGIRPQLVNWRKKELVMDFSVIKQDNTVHILNAISPAFTSSMAFAEHIIKNYIN